MINDFTLINGDCLEELPKLIGEGTKVDLVLTDPPYGNGLNRMEWNNVIPFDKMWDCLEPITYPTSPIVLFGAETYSSKLRLSHKNYKYEWIWEKQIASNFLQAKNRPLKYFENILVFYEKQPTYNKQMIPRASPRIKDAQRTGYEFKGKGGECLDMKYCKTSNDLDPDFKNPSSIIYFPRVMGNSHEYVGHPTQKPVALLEYLIKTYTNQGDIVLDFTMGSGSTGVACGNLNRKFIGIELDKNYYGIAEKRIKEAYNQKRLM